MPRLSEQIADKKEQESTLRRNQEVDAKLDRFIGENPKLWESYGKLSKDELMRKLILKKMNQREFRQGRNAELTAWVAENPEIKAQIEAKVKNVPEQYRERAFITAAKTAAQEQGMRPRV